MFASTTEAAQSIIKPRVDAIGPGTAWGQLQSPALKRAPEVHLPGPMVIQAPSRQ